MSSDIVLNIDYKPSSDTQEPRRGAEGCRPISGVMYTGSIETGYCDATIIVEDTGDDLPLGFLRLQTGEYRIALELTPEVIDALLNHLCDAGNVIENTYEARRLRA